MTTPALTGVEATDRLRATVPLAAFYVGFLWLEVPILSSWGLVLVPIALLLAILIAPVEYALGALACSFVAATSTGLSDLFQTLRWAFLVLGALIFSVRFFLRRRRGPRVHATQFSYLVALFLLVSAASLMSTINVWFTFLKLGALTCLLYVVSRSVIHVVETYGPAAPRQLSRGLFAYVLATILVAAPKYLLAAGAGAYSQKFRGYMGSSNVWACLVSTVLPWMVCPLFRRSRHFFALRWALGLSAVLVGYTLLLTASRAGLVGALVALALLSLVHADRRIAAAVLVVTFLVSVQAVRKPDWVPSLLRRYVYKYQGKDQADMFRSRVGPWETSRRVFLDNPWLGLGFGVTSRAESQWTTNFRSVQAFETGSGLWSSLSQVGLLGSVPVFLAILILVLRAGWFVWRVRDPWLTGIYGSLLALVVNANFEGWLIAPGGFPCTYFWIQCFFLNAMMSRFQPAPVAAVSVCRSPAESLTTVGH